MSASELLIVRKIKSQLDGQIQDVEIPPLEIPESLRSQLAAIQQFRFTSATAEDGWLTISLTRSTEQPAMAQQHHALRGRFRR